MSRAKLVGYATLGWPPHAVGYIGLPVLAAFVGDRDGWTERIGWHSLLGAPFAAAGVSLIAWAIVSHYRASPDEPQMVVRPSYLVTTGAYAVSRNPLYLGGALMWLGWAIVFASPSVVVAGVALFGFLALVGIPYEERLLRRRLGREYDEYARRVPRWFGPRRAVPAGS